MTTAAAPHTPDRIRLTGLSARGRHGVMPFEREEGQLFVVDVTMDVGTRGTAVAAVTDALEDTVDYSAVAGAVVDVVEGPPVNLVETLAERIGDAVLAFPRVEAVEITLHKPQAPLDVAFDDVSVTIVRDSASAQPLSQGSSDGAADAGSEEPTAVDGLAPAAELAAGAAAAGAVIAGAAASMSGAGLDLADEDLAAAPSPSTASAVPELEGPQLGTPEPAAPDEPMEAEAPVEEPSAVGGSDDEDTYAAEPDEAHVGQQPEDDASAPASTSPAWSTPLGGDPAAPAGAAALAVGGAALASGELAAGGADGAGGVSDALPPADAEAPSGPVGPADAEAVVPTPDTPAGDGAAVPPAPAAPEPPAPVDVLAERPAHPVGFVIALGGNVGGVVPALRKAVHTLEDTAGIEVTDLAPLARTAAVVAEGRPAQPDYLNTVVVGLTALSPRELLAVCQGLEADAGRVRTEPKGPRTLDADLITVEGLTSTDPELTLPHPGAAERAFVLVPWAQADPFAELEGRSVVELADAAPDRDGVRWLALDWLTSDKLPALPTGQYVAPPVGEDPASPQPEAGEPAEDADGGEPVVADALAAEQAVPPVGGPEAGVHDEADVQADPAAPQPADGAPQAGGARWPSAEASQDEDDSEDEWSASPAWGDVVGGSESSHGSGLWPGREARESW